MQPNIFIYLYIYARLHPLFLGSPVLCRCATYIGHIEVEQVEQQRFLSWNRTISAGLRAPLKWSTWSTPPIVSRRFHANCRGRRRRRCLYPVPEKPLEIAGPGLTSH